MLQRASLPSICSLRTWHMDLSRISLSSSIHEQRSQRSSTLQGCNDRAEMSTVNNIFPQFLMIDHHHLAHSSLGPKAGSREGLRMKKPAIERTPIITKSQLEPLSVHPIKARLSQISSLQEGGCIYFLGVRKTWRMFMIWIWLLVRS